MDDHISISTINHIFSELILDFFKEIGPLTTQELYKLAQIKSPHLCDDSIHCEHGGRNSGFEWRHKLRRAQEWLQDHNQIEKTGNGK